SRSPRRPAEHRRGRGAHAGAARGYARGHRSRVRVPLLGRGGGHHRPSDQRERRPVPVTGPRLAPLPPHRRDDEVRESLRKGIGNVAAERYLADENAPVPSVIATLLHHPRLASRFLAYNMELLQRPVLDARLRELMVLRVAYRTRAPYEWAQHV